MDQLTNSQQPLLNANIRRGLYAPTGMDESKRVYFQSARSFKILHRMSGDRDGY